MRCALFFIVTLFSFCSTSQEISVSTGEANSRYSFPGRGELTSDAYRLGLIYTTDYAWQFYTNQKLKLEIEAGAHHWQDAFLEEDKTGVYVTPMWRYYFGESAYQPYIGFGIGLSYTNDDEFMDRKLGSRFLFEDRFEAGLILFKDHRLSLSINHYSNADIADINHGVNVYYLNYAYRIK